MALVNRDRVRETTAVTGTGAATLTGVASGPFQPFSTGVGDGNTCFYCISDQAGAGTGTDWEVGVGTYTAATNDVTRTEVLGSSNGGALVNFPVGTKDIFTVYPASKAVQVDDLGKMSFGALGYADFPSAAPAVIAGRMWYDDTIGSWNLGMGGGNITQQVGEELFVYGKATAAISGNTLAQCIYQTGVVGASGVITFAPTIAGITDGNLIQGLATEDIANNGFGRIISFGIIHGINASGSTYGQTWNNNDTLWYDPVNGGLTNVKPVAPNIKVQVGTVLNNGSGGSGSISVEINHGSVLGGTDSNVQLTSVANGNILTYDGGNGYWKNTDLAASTGISVSKSANGVLTLTNTSPDQTVVLNSGTGISVTGTYPNFTIASTVTSPIPAGTVMVFYQAAAPSGWTKLTTVNDTALRIVSGATGGSTGGTVAFSTAFSAANTVDGTAISTAQMPVHNHGITDPGHSHTVTDPTHNHVYNYWTQAAVRAGSNGPSPINSTSPNTSNSATGISIAGATTGITTNNAGSGSTHNHTLTNLAVKYADVILCSKN